MNAFEIYVYMFVRLPYTWFAFWHQFGSCVYLLVCIIFRKEKNKKKEQEDVSNTMQPWLVIILFICLLQQNHSMESKEIHENQVVILVQNPCKNHEAFLVSRHVFKKLSFVCHYSSFWNFVGNVCICYTHAYHMYCPLFDFCIFSKNSCS